MTDCQFCSRDTPVAPPHKCTAAEQDCRASPGPVRSRSGTPRDKHDYLFIYLYTQIKKNRETCKYKYYCRSCSNISIFHPLFSPCNAKTCQECSPEQSCCCRCWRAASLCTCTPVSTRRWRTRACWATESTLDSMRSRARARDRRIGAGTGTAAGASLKTWATGGGRDTCPEMTRCTAM